MKLYYKKSDGESIVCEQYNTYKEICERLISVLRTYHKNVNRIIIPYTINIDLYKNLYSFKSYNIVQVDADIKSLSYNFSEMKNMNKRTAIFISYTDRSEEVKNLYNNVVIIEDISFNPDQSISQFGDIAISLSDSFLSCDGLEDENCFINNENVSFLEKNNKTIIPVRLFYNKNVDFAVDFFRQKNINIFPLFSPEIPLVAGESNIVEAIRAEYFLFPRFDKKIVDAINEYISIYKERDNTWYDFAYKKSCDNKTEYSYDPDKCIYYNLWAKIIDFLTTEERVIDFGCGVGQFSKLAVKNRINYILGIDFSDFAISKAKEDNPDIQFMCKNLYDEDIFLMKDFDTAIFCEVLEHISDDIGVISKIPSGKRVIITLPTFNAESHVRYFLNTKEISDRYENILNISKTETAELSNGLKIILIDSTKI